MTHLYLVWSLAITGLALAAIPFSRAPAALVLTSGALAAPAGLADRLFVPDYWAPDHLFGAWFSIEGVLFSFGNGCLVIMIAARFEPRLQLWTASGLRRPLIRLTTCMALGFCAFLLVWDGAFGRLMIMHATFAGFLAISVLILIRGTVSPRSALLCGAGFLLLYWIETMLAHLIDPNFHGFWPDRSYIARLPLPPGVPVEEYLWAFAYGAVWSAMFLDSFAPRRGPADRPTGTPDLTRTDPPRRPDRRH